MWIIEINFAGHRFTHRVRGRRRPSVRSRSAGWRPTPQTRVA